MCKIWPLIMAFYLAASKYNAKVLSSVRELCEEKFLMPWHSPNNTGEFCHAVGVIDSFSSVMRLCNSVPESGESPRRA